MRRLRVMTLPPRGRWFERRASCLRCGCFLDTGGVLTATAAATAAAALTIENSRVMLLFAQLFNKPCTTISTRGEVSTSNLSPATRRTDSASAAARVSRRVWTAVSGGLCQLTVVSLTVRRRLHLTPPVCSGVAIDFQLDRTSTANAVSFPAALSMSDAVALCHRRRTILSHFLVSLVFSPAV